ncbi:helix-turn-helix transcriptional regulator [Natronorarus salvus]|uniref:helix-turn-helix transcriptional regulator n=1 Tax=Natronorarus salvus TaxID=3117733 RepID=UPI002F25F3DA
MYRHTVRTLALGASFASVTGVTGATAWGGGTDPGRTVSSVSVDGAVAVFLSLLVVALAGSAVVLWRRSGAAGDRSASQEGEARHGSTSADPETPNDRERVLSLLERNDGRMRQVRIVDETDWSKSKTSVVLTGMEAEGLVSKLRVGRENIVSLAGREFDTAPGSVREQ